MNYQEDKPFEWFYLIEKIVTIGVASGTCKNEAIVKQMNIDCFKQIRNY